MNLSVRGSHGIYHISGPPNYEKDPRMPVDESKNCKVMAFSADGKYFAWNNGHLVTLVAAAGDSSSWNVVGTLPESQRTVFLSFSPQSTILATWEVFAVRQEGVDPNNLRLWSTTNCQLLFSTTHRKADTWKPQWTKDESLVCLRSPNNEAVFYVDKNFQTTSAKLSLPKLDSFHLSAVGTKKRKAHVVAYVPGQKGGPGFGKLFGYPNFRTEDTIASKSFMTADSMDVKWSCDGKCVLMLTHSEIDKTGASYYGKTQLHYADVDGSTASVQLPKDGPVYSVEWSPVAIHFIVVYGFMPAKATLFNKKLEPVFDLGTGPRNFGHFNPQGNLLTLGGFGNLHGNLEVWDVQGEKRVSQFEASDATAIDWSPDGQLMVTSTCAPRLRIGNGFRVWHYTGTLFHETLFAESTKPPQASSQANELWEVKWRPSKCMKTFVVLDKPVPGGIKSQQPLASKQVYRPPMARGKPFHIKVHDDEIASNDKVETSKAAAKNKKRRQAAKHGGGGGGEPSVSVEPPTQFFAPTGCPEKDKKLRKLNDKLNGIQKLKLMVGEGKKLEANQLEKLKKEAEIVDEMKSLQL